MKRPLPSCLPFCLLASLCALPFAAASAQTPAQPDLTKQPTLYVVGYAHLDTEWRWEYPQVINEYIRKTMEGNFALIDKYPHYIFNFSGANRYRFMKEYFPADFAKVKQYVNAGRWFPAGSSMEEGDVNAPSAEAIIRQVLYGNNWFRKELGKASNEYMLPDCFGFPASLPSILASSGVKGFSTQKLVWGSSADAGGPESKEKTPEGTPFDVGVWVGPDGEAVLAALNPGSYSGDIATDLSKPLPPLPPDPRYEEIEKQVQAMRPQIEKQFDGELPADGKQLADFFLLNREREALAKMQEDREHRRYQDDWAARVEHNGQVTGVKTDYHYYGTGDVGGTPDEDSVKRLEAIVTGGETSFPPEDYFSRGPDEKHPDWPQVKVGNGPVHVLSAPADQMFLDISATEASALPRYTGEMELTNHSAGSLTSQAYQKRWLRKEELLADAAEKSSLMAQWLGARPYPLPRLNDAWTLVMGGHFHDIAAGTATPKAYEFAWNDDVIALNQFAGVLEDATTAVSAALNTNVKGTPVVVFNPLEIEREDVVEATLPANMMGNQITVSAPDGRRVPAQLSNSKVVFLAKMPPASYAVYDIASSGETAHSPLRVSENSLENEYYRVHVNASGDVDSIFDKATRREVLSSPARLAISYDNPTQWPAWNMDWDQEQAAPREYVGGAAQIRVVENGLARVALEITRQTAGSKFVQTVSLSAGDAGKRIEFANAVDWNTRESNLKATFPLAASNRVATYNWDIGTIERPTAQPKKFEVPSHQWIDLTDASEEFGATVLTDCKNGSDKPTDNSIRLTLLRTPGVRGGFPDQATQDLGHHEFTFGLAPHVGGWRQAETDWQAQRLNDPLIAFAAAKHDGPLGREFSFFHLNNPRVRVLALKKAEASDELIVRLVELDGRPQSNVRLQFAAPITAAREVNGQEQPVGSAALSEGALVTSFSAYQPRTFALKLAPASMTVPAVHSTPVSLPYDLATATNDGTHSKAGIDGKGDSLPAEMLPSDLRFDDVGFHLAVQSGAPNAAVARGQKISLPQGRFNRVYILASAVNGDQTGAFTVGASSADLKIQDWTGYIGQWDNRQWTAKDTPVPARPGEPAHTEHDPYDQMTGIAPGYIKRADIAWYCSHHHNAAGENVPYGYSYLFAYALDLPAGAKTLTLPDNRNIRVFAVSVAEQNPQVQPAQPLYDTLAPVASAAH